MGYRHIVLALIIVGLVFAIVFFLLNKTNHVVAGYLSALVSLGLAVLVGWLLVFPKLAPVRPTGEFDVAVVDSHYVDTARVETYASDGSCRGLAVTFWYPESCPEGERLPLVVFSHGSLGVRTSNETLYNELASHGYVVCAMDHTYQCFSTTNSEGEKVRVDFGFLKDVMRVNPDKNPVESYQHQREWMDIRMDDISFILDTILEKAEEKSEELPVYHLIDASRIALIGHSLGGSGALGIGRTRGDISAIVSLEAPFMYDIKGIEDGAFVFDETEYPTPLLLVYSDTAWEAMGQWGLYAQNNTLLRSKRPDIRSVHISGSNHLGLTDFCMTTPFLSDLFSGSIAKNKPQETMREVNKACLEFLDEYVLSRGSDDQFMSRPAAYPAW